jgi:hypothetical protein
MAASTKALRRLEMSRRVESKGVGTMPIIRYCSYFLLAFAAICWIGAAVVGLSNMGQPFTDDIKRAMDMFTGAAMTSSLLPIALGIWFKE